MKSLWVSVLGEDRRTEVRRLWLIFAVSMIALYLLGAREWAGFLTAVAAIGWFLSRPDDTIFSWLFFAIATGWLLSLLFTGHLPPDYSIAHH